MELDYHKKEPNIEIGIQFYHCLCGGIITLKKGKLQCATCDKEWENEKVGDK